MKKLKKTIRALLTVEFINIPVASFFSVFKKFLPARLKKLLLRIPVNKTFSTKFDDREIIFYGNGNDAIATQVYWDGIEAYEKETVRLINFISKEVRTFFDIGANTGIYSLIAASSHRKISAHSFEPMKDAFEILKKNKELNNFSNMNINLLAISSFNGESTLHIPRGDDKIIPLGASLGEVVEESKTYDVLKVPTMRVDTYMKNVKLDILDFLKVDTEGMEPEVFAGAKKTLKNSRPIIICEVLYDRIENKLHEIFDTQSYIYYLISNQESQNFKLKKCDKIIGDKFVVCNYLLIPSEKNYIADRYINN